MWPPCISIKAGWPEVEWWTVDCTELHCKQLLDEVFVISRIIQVEVRVISRRLRLIILTETLIILDITKTESNNCFMIH